MYYDVYILACIMKKPCYGYEIKKMLTERFSACSDISNNTLYPLLRKYEKKGAISKETALQKGKPSRIIYTITPTGKELFTEMLCDTSDSYIQNRDEFMMKLVFFDFIPPEKRTELLDKRHEYLSSSKTYVEDRRDKLDSDSKYLPKSNILGDFHLKLLALELELAEKYRSKVSDPLIKP